MARKVCKKCLLFVQGSECPHCKCNQFSTNWQGRIAITDAQRSSIAKKIDIDIKGEYALKAR